MLTFVIEIILLICMHLLCGVENQTLQHLFKEYRQYLHNYFLIELIGVARERDVLSPDNDTLCGLSELRSLCPSGYPCHQLYPQVHVCPYHQESQSCPPEAVSR